MIKAKELRIGNFLYRQTLPVIPANFINKEIISVGKVDEDLFNDKIDCQFAPIPLTEEWLLKFGFEKYDEEYWFNPQYPSYEICINNPIRFYLPEDIKDESEYYSTKDSNCVIKYVHQLQNLYHALTGQELQLTNSN